MIPLRGTDTDSTTELAEDLSEVVMNENSRIVDDIRDVLGLLIHRREELNPLVVVVSHVLSTGYVNQEIFGSFMTKTEADEWVGANQDTLSMIGDNVQVKELRPVDGPATTIFP